MLLIPDVFISHRDERARAMAMLDFPEAKKARVMDAIMAPQPESPLKSFTGVLVRFKKIQVLNNHATTIFGKDASADVYPIVMVVSDAVTTAYDLVPLNVFNDIKDNDFLPISNALSVARYYSHIPRFIDIHLVVMKSNEHKRDVAKAINEAVSSKEGATITTSLNAIVTSANPVAGTIVAVATSLLSLVTGYLSKEKDQQIFYGVASFDDDPDNLGIDGPREMTDGKNARATFEVIGQKKAP